MWISNNSFGKGFVKIFANWFLDLQNSTKILLLFISSQIKWYLVSICLLFLWKTWFFESVMVDLLSRKIWVGSSYSCSNSNIILLIHIVWHATVYSSSSDDKVTMDCFFETHATAPNSKLNTYPDVFFLSSTQPAKSLSIYPINLKSKYDVYRTP